ncbi:hypothetical protein [Luteolibacter sp. AS25]|uniref:hypothetical protein n=1 Tax=Luteolibacter sp. AS25 TaxID=3135776 RepID=UPI00398AD6E0
MNRIKLLLLIVLFTSCRSGEERTIQREAGSDHLTHVILQSTVSEDRLRRILWQRGYPDEYAQLIAEAEASRSGDDPFIPPITTPDRDLIPIGFHDRPPIIPTILAQLGWPLPDGAEAIYRAEEGVIEITHQQEAIRAFKEHFPELVEDKNKANKAEMATPRNPSD